MKDNVYEYLQDITISGLEPVGNYNIFCFIFPLSKFVVSLWETRFKKRNMTNSSTPLLLLENSRIRKFMLIIDFGPAIFPFPEAKICTIYNKIVLERAGEKDQYFYSSFCSSDTKRYWIRHFLRFIYVITYLRRIDYATLCTKPYCL